MNQNVFTLPYQLGTILLLIPFLLASCASPVTHNDHEGDNAFTVKAIQQSFKPNSIDGNPEYHFTGTVKNNTKSVFSQATVFMSVIFILDNGKEITDMDNHEEGNHFSWAGDQALEALRMFEPNQTVTMDEMISADVPKAYQKYPITSVHLRFKVKYIDEVNNVENEVYLPDQDVTAEWNAFFDPQVSSNNPSSPSSNSAAVSQADSITGLYQGSINLPSPPPDVYSAPIEAENNRDQLSLQTGFIMATHNYGGDQTLTICFKDKTNEYHTGRGYVLDEAGVAYLPSGSVDSTVYVPGRRVAFKTEYMGTNAGSDQLMYLKVLPASSVHMPAQVKITKQMVYNP